MRYHIAVKFIAIALAALALFASIGSAVGIITLATMDLYENSVDALYEKEMSTIRRDFAVNLAHRYASVELGKIPENYLRTYHATSWQYDTFAPGQFYYVLRSETGEAVDSTLPEDLEGATRYDITVTEIRYRRLVQGGIQSQPQEPSAPAGAQPAPASDQSSAPELHQDSYYDYDQNRHVELLYTYDSLPPYTVELYLLDGAMPEDPMWSVLKILWVYRYQLFYVLGAAILSFAATAVYLCCAAGRRPGSDEVRPGGLNRIPLDAYALAMGLLGFLAVSVCVLGSVALARHSPGLLIPFLCFGGTGTCLLAVALLYACAAQFKAPDRFWWRRSVIGFVAIRLGRLLGRLLRGCGALAAMLPVVWQWLLTAFLMALSALITFLFAALSDGWLQPFFVMVFVLCVLGCIGVVCYGGYCFGVLIKGARYMARGNLYYQIPTRYLLGAFRDFALELNSLAGAAQLAAERQMRSERMKTELITNVSHDIKTPLTSIINYVDLMKLPHTPQEDGQYLEVLDRQSQRLKKLVDDLMEMSRASSGNMNVDVTRMDAAETINQALGEFADKLARAQLTPLFQPPLEPVYMLADGRLVWRVLSNVLGNAVKYAMPNTRLYIDLLVLENRVIISIKNISREQLNVRADELLERFVRGDLSRNTEGSGLGLNIAQSLMELQKGQLQLLVDGDLFKVTLIFPGA